MTFDIRLWPITADVFRRCKLEIRFLSIRNPNEVVVYVLSSFLEECVLPDFPVRGSIMKEEF